MPLYAYRCPHGHTHDELFKADARPDTTPCPTCTATATYTLGAPAPGIVTGSTNPLRSTSAPEGYTVTYETETMRIREKGSAPTLVDWECADGHVHFEVYDTVPDEAPACPTCLQPTRRVVGVPDLDWFTKSYPHGHHDPSLGCFVRSRTHLEQILRERNLVPMAPSEVNRRMAEDVARDEAKARDDEEVVKEMLYSYSHGPDAAMMHRYAEENPSMDWREHAKQLGVD